MHSQVLLISFLQVYCMEEGYLHRGFRIACEWLKDLSKILPHQPLSWVCYEGHQEVLCLIHYATNINVIGFFPFRFQNEQCRFSIYCFSIAVNHSTLDESSKIICLLKLLYNLSDVFFSMCLLQFKHSSNGLFLCVEGAIFGL